MTAPRQLLTTEEVASLLRLSPRTVRRLSRGTRPPLKRVLLGRLVRYRPEDVEALQRRGTG